MQASVAQDSRYHEGTLHTATFLLTDFGRAVPYKDIIPGLPGTGAAGAPQEARGGPQQLLQRYNKDGVVVFSDPTYQPPEVRWEEAWAGGSCNLTIIQSCWGFGWRCLLLTHQHRQVMVLDGLVEGSEETCGAGRCFLSAASCVGRHCYKQPQSVTICCCS